MKLLIVTQVVDKNHPILGFFHRWIEEFAKHFDEIHVICLEKGVYDLPEHVHVYSLGKEEGESRLKYFYRFYKYFGYVYFKKDIDYVFFHMGAIFTLLAFPFALLRYVTKIKFYWWKTHAHIGLKEKLSLFFIDRVYTASENSFPIISKKRKVVGHAIDFSRFILSSKERHGILFAGRVMSVKRVEDVIAVLTHVPDQKLEIVGQIPDKEYETKLQALVKEKHLHERVSFTGGVPQDALITKFAEAKVFISPSDTDSVDKVVLEAMACGTPAVTTTEAFRDLLTPFGMFVEKRDIVGMVRAIEWVLTLSQEEYRKLGSDLREAVIKDHDIQTLTERIFN